jgi:phenylacetate-CoA ligase
VGVTEALYGRLIWPLWARRDDPRYPAYAAEVARRQFDPPAVLAARQAVALRRVVGFAAERVPYYRALFGRIGLRADDVRGPRDLSRLPVLTKADVRTRAAELLAEGCDSITTVEKTTSGSTGVPLRVRLDRRGLAWKRACTLVADEWSGWRRGGTVAKAWGNPEYRQFGIKGWLRNRLFERAIHLDTLEMAEGDIAAFVRRLARYRPSLIFGHAHSVYLLARFIRENGLPACRPAGIITTAMILHDFQRRLIENVFACPVTNRYGCEEVSLIACECPAHNGLHVNGESVLVEILDGDRAALPGQSGRVVITDLSNYAMPLLRYEVGDVAAWSTRPCPCGRSSAVLAAVEGREADYVVTAGGQFISGISLTENFATLVPGVEQIQIVQDAVDRFVFRVVAGPAFERGGRKRMAELVRDRFGPAATFTCELVASIPQEPSGKYRFCISRVAAAARLGAAA